MIEKKDGFVLLMEGNYMVGSGLKKVLPISDDMGRLDSTFTFSIATFHRAANLSESHLVHDLLFFSPERPHFTFGP